MKIGQFGGSSFSWESLGLFFFLILLRVKTDTTLLELMKKKTELYYDLIAGVEAILGTKKYYEQK